MKKLSRLADFDDLGVMALVWKANFTRDFVRLAMFSFPGSGSINRLSSSLSSSSSVVLSFGSLCGLKAPTSPIPVLPHLQTVHVGYDAEGPKQI